MYSKLITSIFLLSFLCETCFASEHITDSYIKEKLQTITNPYVLEIKQKLGAAKFQRPKILKIAMRKEFQKPFKYVMSNDWINPEDRRVEYLIHSLEQEAYKTKKTDFGPRSFLYRLIGITHFKGKDYIRAIESYDMVLGEEILEIFNLNLTLVQLAKIHYLMGDFELSQDLMYLGIYVLMTKVRTRDKDISLSYQKELLHAIEQRANPEDFRTRKLFLPGTWKLEGS